jgi:hypothetical protein
MSRDNHPPLRDVNADMAKTVSSVVACWTVFTEMLPGNELIKSVTISNCYYIFTAHWTNEMYFTFQHTFDWNICLYGTYHDSLLNRSCLDYTTKLRIKYLAVNMLDVCDRPRLPSLWLGSHRDYSPTAHAAPSLRPLVASGPLIRCQWVHVYHHHPSFGRCGKMFRKWSVLLHLWPVLCV